MRPCGSAHATSFGLAVCDHGAMDKRGTSERDRERTVAVLVAVALVTIAALDLAFPSLSVVLFMVPALAVSALFTRPKVVIALGVLALVLSVLVEARHGGFSSTDGWLQLAGQVIGIGIIVLFAVAITGWRARVLQREEQYRMLAENASDIVARVEADGTIAWVSPSVSAVLGRTPESLIGTAPWDLVHPDDLEAAVTGLAHAGDEDDHPVPMAARFITPDGDYVWMSAAARELPAGDFAVSFRLVDAEVRAAQALAESESRYRLLAENTMDMVISLDTHAMVQWVSSSTTSMLGYEPDELVGVFGGTLINSEDLPLLLDASAQARAGHPSSCRIRMVTKDGANRWVEATPRGLYDEDLLVGGVIGVRDIHGEVTAHHALQHEVQFDSLTGLAGRALALERIDEILQARGDRSWALLCVGVNGMTAINQAYTYVAGDHVLTEVARRLVAVAGAADRVARIAGDEFVVMLNDVVTATDAANAAERILAAVHGRIAVADTEVDVTACVGVAMAHGVEPQDLLRDATAAMRQASAKGTDRWEFLDGNVGRETRHALAVQGSLRDALAGGLIVPWFMPIVSFAHRRAVGYEALVRWVTDDGIVMPPDTFLDIAERTGLILEVDRTILSQSLDAIEALPTGVSVAVNVSAATLSSGRLDEWVRGELARTGVHPSRLHLEVTETALFHVTGSVREGMQSLADLGVTWWMDDFGTGFSSISHIRDLPVVGLKLDRAFTAGVSYDDNHATRLALGLAGLAEGLGLHTVAEGVETAEQAAVLASQGWETGQGWLYGKAVPLSALTASSD